MNFLEKKVKELDSLDEDCTVEMAISAMQSELSTDFKSSEIEVAVVSKGSTLRLLSEDMVEA